MRRRSSQRAPAPARRCSQTVRGIHGVATLGRHQARKSGQVCSKRGMGERPLRGVAVFGLPLDEVATGSRAVGNSHVFELGKRSEAAMACSAKISSSSSFVPLKQPSLKALLRTLQRWAWTATGSGCPRAAQGAPVLAQAELSISLFWRMPNRFKAIKPSLHLYTPIPQGSDCGAPAPGHLMPSLRKSTR